MEKAIREKLGLVIDNPIRAPFFEFADEQLTLEENQGHCLVVNYPMMPTCHID
jgi:hypothetical protein